MPKLPRLSFSSFLPVLFLSTLSLAAAAAPVVPAACPSLAPAEAAALSLATVLARVPACHPDVRVAGFATAAASADLITAGQGPNPQLTVGAGGLSHELGGGGPWNQTFDHQLRVDQLIERGDKPGLRRAGAVALQQAAAADAADALRQARLAAGRAYFDLAAALARQQQMNESAALQADSQRAIETRVRAGDAAALDAVRIGLDGTRVAADLRQALADIQGQRLQLAALIGADDQADLLTPGADFEPSPVAAAALDAAAAAAAVEQRADVRAAIARAAAAARARALAAAQRTRDVGVGLALSRYPTSAANPAGTGNTLSLSVSVPLFVRHAYEGETARAEADLQSAEENLRRVRLAASGSVARARADWLAADARDALISQQLLPAAERVAAGAELAYKRGASSVLDVLDARRSLRAARIDRINAQNERAKAALALDAALPNPDMP